MTEARRYGDDEVREIFELASRADAVSAPEPDGLTLDAIQEIGREVGLEPAVIARAAAAVEARSMRVATRTSMGMPVRVGRTIPLPRELTDGEWERLVGELRTTFGARGRVSGAGGLREWANGNLHACIEPARDGYRLRIQTIKGNAAPLNAVGVGGMLAGVFAFVAFALPGGAPAAYLLPGLISATGAAAVAANLARLPGWARTRERQMETIEAKVAEMLAE